MKYFNDQMETLLDQYVSGMIHEIEYLKAIKAVADERLEWHRDNASNTLELLKA
jgi:hypothetical protein